MKLTVLSNPPFGFDSGVVLRDESDKTIILRCTDANATAREIVRRVNWFDPMIALLATFGSNEMGNVLIDVVVAYPPPDASKEQIAEVERRMRALVNAVDVILKGYELAREKERAEG